MLKEAERKVQFLTGCAEFGNTDGMDGSCQTCFHEDRALFDRCMAFGHAYREYRTKQIQNEITIIPPNSTKPEPF